MISIWVKFTVFDDEEAKELEEIRSEKKEPEAVVRKETFGLMLAVDDQVGSRLAADMTINRMQEKKALESSHILAKREIRKNAIGKELEKVRREKEEAELKLKKTRKTLAEETKEMEEMEAWMKELKDREMREHNALVRLRQAEEKKLRAIREEAEAFRIDCRSGEEKLAKKRKNAKKKQARYDKMRKIAKIERPSWVMKAVTTKIDDQKLRDAVVAREFCSASLLKIEATSKCNDPQRSGYNMAELGIIWPKWV